jgi:signal transduction histidine kinase
MWATGSPWISVRLVCAVIVAANLVAAAAFAGWETLPIHLLLVAAGVFYLVRPPQTIPSRDAILFGAALTLATIGNELLEGIEPVNDVYEAWLVFLLVVGLGWLAVRRAQAAEALAVLVAERERMLRRQERLMYDLSHELRTPATIARGHLEQLQTSSGHAFSAVVIALDELARIDRIVERLLLLARAERGRLVELGEVEPDQFLEDILLRWSETADRSWRLGSVPPGTLRADPEALRIALDALLENAIKYTEQGDSIELRADVDAGDLVIEVADSGPGVPLDAAESIFARSARSRSGEARPGLGIGLAIVDSIATAHGGGCVLESTSEGSTFAIRLPGFTPADAADSDSPAEGGRLDELAAGG